MKSKSFKSLSIFPLTLSFLEAVCIGVFIAPATAGAAPPAIEAPALAKPTIVLVHGAFAGSSSWNGVASRLIAKGYPVVAVANPLRGLKSDSAYLASQLDGIQGPIVAVGHSYGGLLITNAGSGKAKVKALVYVAAFAPEIGESAIGLSGRFPGSTLGAALAMPVELPDGGKDLYIKQDKFRTQFAADVPAAEASLMAATQRPVTESALKEPADSTAWKSIPSWFIFGSHDKNIPEAAHAFMAQRASSKGTLNIKGASHVVMISHPDEVSSMIVQAAEFVTRPQEAAKASR